MGLKCVIRRDAVGADHPRSIDDDPIEALARSGGAGAGIPFTFASNFGRPFGATGK